MSAWPTLADCRLQLPERASETVIELDSMTLPTLLYGHEQADQQALSSQKVNMAAGEIQQRISVRTTRRIHKSTIILTKVQAFVDLVLILPT